MAKLSTPRIRLGRTFGLGLGLLAVGLIWAGLDRGNAVFAQKSSKNPKDPSKETGTPLLTKREPGVYNEPSISQVREINRIVEQVWKENDVVRPSSICTDYEFIRRASLDIIGRIAKPEEIEKFMADPPSLRRANLIERLLESDEYASNWANLWTIWLMTRSAPALYRSQMATWVEEFLQRKEPKERSYDRMVTELITATGKTNDNGAVNFILTHLGEQTPQNRRAKEGPFDVVPLTSRVTRLFLGIQTQCCQCHDHKFNTALKQKHFWGINAFFRQIEREGNPMMRNNNNADPPVLTLRDNLRYNEDETIVYESSTRATMHATRPKFLDDRTFNKSKTPNRREALAQMLISHEMFPKAFANRLWAHFTGRSMTVTAAFDDFHDNNLPVMTFEDEKLAKELNLKGSGEHGPSLLDYIAREFRNGGFDTKDLIRWITLSKVYNLSSVADGEIAETKDGKTVKRKNNSIDDEIFFTRVQLKAMSPEQLFESLWVSTYSIIQKRGAKANDEEYKKLREEWLSRLVVNFGDDEGNETTFNGTVIQALMLMNGKELTDAVTHKDGMPARAVERHKGAENPVKILDELYKVTLNRPPTQAEITRILGSSPGRTIGGAIQPADPRLFRQPEHFWRGVWQDIFWALLNSNEFILNH
jgi:hypothetical protein